MLYFYGNISTRLNFNKLGDTMVVYCVKDIYYIISKKKKKKDCYYIR